MQEMRLHTARGLPGRAIPEKKLRVLLLSPDYGHMQTIMSNTLPLGIAYLAGYFKDHPFVELTTPCFESTGKPWRRLVEESDYDVLCTGGMITFLDFYIDFFRHAAEHAPQALRVVGGPVTTAYDPDLLFGAMNVHAAVYGEGEKSLEELLWAHAMGQPLQDVAGVMHRDAAGRVVRNARRKSIDLQTEDLRPDWSVFDLETVFANPAMGRALPFLGSRGCPNRCHYCGSPMGKHRFRKVEWVIDELRDLIARYGVTNFVFQDETLAASSGEMEALCRGILDSGFQISWDCFLRTDAVSEASLKLMKAAGCRTILYGLESGSPATLKRMNKRNTVEHSRTAIQLSQNVGLIRNIAIMLGYIDETKDDIRQTIDLMLELNELPSSIALPTPIPGTPLFRECQKRGLIDDPIAFTRSLRDRVEGDKSFWFCNPTDMNLTQIPDAEFLPFVRHEIMRLYTGHFARNKAYIDDVTRAREGGGHFDVRCPHCQTPARIAFGKLKWSYAQLCSHCHRWHWIDLRQAPPFTNYWHTVNDFLQRAIASDGELILYATQDGFHLGNLLKVDPWGVLLEYPRHLITPHQERYHYVGIEASQLAEFENPFVLILDADPGRAIAKDLGQYGVPQSHCLPIFPSNEA